MPEKYGKYYWCVKVAKSLSKSGEIYLYADEVEVLNACVVFRQIDSGHKINLMIPLHLVTAVYAASCMDGAAVAVEHWDGEVQR